MLNLLELLLAAICGVLSLVARMRGTELGRLQERDDNLKIIEAEVKDANQVYNNLNIVDDNFLLEPNQRGVGGVQGLQANLRGEQGGSAGVAQTNGGGKNQGAQSGLGKKLPVNEFKIPAREVHKVYIHCSASDRVEDDNVQVIDSWHKARGWAGIGYHFYVDKQGRVWQGRDVEKIPASQYHYNLGTIAICCGGLNGFTDVQMAALTVLCRAVNAAYLNAGKPVTFHGHCEVSAKTCPNFDYRKVLGLDAKGVMA